MITKDQASDLESLIRNLRLRALEQQNATLAYDEASKKLSAYIWKLQQAESKEKS